MASNRILQRLLCRQSLPKGNNFLFRLKKITPVCSVKLCSTTDEPSTSNRTQMTFKNGFPVIKVVLPSRREGCEFTLHPVSQTVRDFLDDLTAEDGGIERAAIYSVAGTRVAKSTRLDVLLQNDFRLIVNDETIHVEPPLEAKVPMDNFEAVSHLKTLINQLYCTMNVEEYQLGQERELRKKLEDLQAEIEPLEKEKQSLEEHASKRTQVAVWGGLAFMSLQFGLLARLTWWEYSWDIMEPVTYFVGYGTAMACYAYYVLTKQEYIFPQVRDRYFLLKFYKFSKKKSFDVHKYNLLKDKIAKIEDDIKGMENPYRIHLPLPSLQSGKK